MGVPAKRGPDSTCVLSEGVQGQQNLCQIAKKLADMN